MAKIMLFGSSTIFGIPDEIIGWLMEYTKQGHEFIVGDSKGADTAFQKALSSVGAVERSTVYSMGEPRNNTYNMKTVQFNTYYDEDKKQAAIFSNINKSDEPDAIIEDIEKEMDIQHNRGWYEFKDKRMARECDMAIGLWDGSSKGTLHLIQFLNIIDKPCYTFTISV